MKVKPTWWLLALTLSPAFFNKTLGQYYYYNHRYLDTELVWEFGVSAGTMHALTDVGRKKHTIIFPLMFDYSSTKTSAGIYVGATYQNFIGVRLEVTYGGLAGADSNGIYPLRNLSYRTTIHEIAGMVEFHPFMVKDREQPWRMSPYILAGLGGFTFNPQAYFQDRWIYLHPLRTEGQAFREYPGRDQYKLLQLCVPFGGGLRYEISPFFTARAEGVLRYTFTDYIDDASTTYIDASLFKNYIRPFAPIAEALSHRYRELDPAADLTGYARAGSKSKDLYFTFNLKLSLNFGRRPR